MKTKIYTLLVMVLPIAASAQKASEDFKKCRNYYVEHNNIAFTVQTKNFASKNDTKGTKTETGTAKLHKNNYYSSYAGNEVYVNSKGTFMIDHTGKSCTWFHAKNKSESSPADINFEAMLKQCDSVKYEGVQGTTKKYVLYTRKREVEKTEIWLDVKTHRLEKMTMTYMKNTGYDFGAYKTEVSYTNYKTGENSKNDFEFDGFLEKKGDTWKTAGKIKGYKLNYVE